MRNHSRGDEFFLNKAYASLYMATMFEKTARTIIKILRILSLLVAMPYRSLRVTAAGNMNPMQTAAVAPVNWNASQMLGMKFAPKKMMAMRPPLIKANLKLSRVRGLAEGNTRPSKLSRSG